MEKAVKNHEVVIRKGLVSELGMGEWSVFMDLDTHYCLECEICRKCKPCLRGCANTSLNLHSKSAARLNDHLQ
jgi:hypothetical protein